MANCSNQYQSVHIPFYSYTMLYHIISYIIILLILSHNITILYHHISMCKSNSKSQKIPEATPFSYGYSHMAWLPQQPSDRSDAGPPGPASRGAFHWRQLGTAGRSGRRSPGVAAWGQLVYLRPWHLWWMFNTCKHTHTHIYIYIHTHTFMYIYI